MNLILPISVIEISLRRIKLDNAVVLHKLAEFRSSVVPHERTNATTEALVDVLYICRLIAVTFLFVTVCFFTHHDGKSTLSL
jgi:hypothetical protein